VLIETCWSFSLQQRKKLPVPWSAARLFLKLALLISVCLLGSCALNGDKDDNDSPAAQLFAKHCVACHGPNGEGKQVSGQIVPSLNTGHALTDGDEILRRQIQRGGKGMPPFDYQITPEQLNDLVRYIRQVQDKHKVK